jgi:hypothetical protein
MKLVGIMPVRNEDWCLGLTLRAALQWCDDVCVYVHASSDCSAEIVHDVRWGHPTRCGTPRGSWTSDFHEEWDEMKHRNTLLSHARVQGATHIAIIDADEILTRNLLGSIRTLAEGVQPGELLYLPGYNLRGGLSHYHADGVWGQRWFSVVFADNPKLSWTGDCFHHREPFGFEFRAVKPIPQHEGGIMHLWGVSERRLKAKHAFYKITERLRWPEKPISEIETTYNLWKTIRSLAKVPESWWEPYKDWMKYLDIDKEPWQEAECRRLVELHGLEMFDGLDLFGVV